MKVYVAVLLGRVAVQVLSAPAITLMPPEQATVAEPPAGRPVRVSITVPPLGSVVEDAVAWPC